MRSLVVQSLPVRPQVRGTVIESDLPALSIVCGVPVTVETILVVRLYLVVLEVDRVNRDDFVTISHVKFNRPVSCFHFFLVPFPRSVGRQRFLSYPLGFVAPPAEVLRIEILRTSVFFFSFSP